MARLLIIFTTLITYCFSQTIVYLADHFDPNYTDPCLEQTGELCQFCCLDASATCSSYILWCHPVEDRNLESLWFCFYILGGIIFGFPIIVVVIRYILVFRVGTTFYPAVAGISSFECIARSFYFCFFCKRFSQTYKMADDDQAQENEEKSSSRFGCCRRKKSDNEGNEAVEVWLKSIHFYSNLQWN